MAKYNYYLIAALGFAIAAIAMAFDTGEMTTTRISLLAMDVVLTIAFVTIYFREKNSNKN